MDHKPPPTENRDSQSDVLRPPIEAKKSRWGFRGMTVREWLELLIVPVVLALITVVFTWQQNQRQQDLETKRTNHAQEIENERAAAERELAKERAQDEALQAYLGQMSNLLLERKLRESAKDGEVRTLARARTLTVLSRLDSARKERLLQFLYEAGLVHKEDPVINLNGANLSGIDLHRNNLSGSGPFLIPASGGFSQVEKPSNAANLSGAILSDANLEGAFLLDTDLSGADLSGADLNKAELWGTDLSSAYLQEADLSGATLFGAKLFDANLSDADLSGAYLTKERGEGPWANRGSHARNVDLSSAILKNSNLSDANLSGANLSLANLSNANLAGAKLSGADLSEANMSGAEGIAKEELEDQAASIEGATMPNGQKMPLEPLPLEPAYQLMGRAYVTDEYAFEPAFRFAVGSWWWAPSTQQTADELLIEQTWPERGYLIFTSPLNVFAPRNPSEQKEVPAPENVDEWVSWFQSHPNLETSKPVPASVGGASGMRIDVAVTSTPENYPRDDCEQPCVSLYPSSVLSTPSAESPTRGGSIRIYEETKVRYFIVDVKGETVVINVSASPDKFDEFLPKAQKVLDTVEWRGAQASSSGGDGENSGPS
jgi:uncharacterized protein YjbI with pentapeptide repeats